MEQAGVAAQFWPLKILGMLGHLCSAEALIRLPDLPDHECLDLLQSVMNDLKDLHSDRRGLARVAAETERHQQAAGLASHLSAVDLQRLVLLLHNRCARHAARGLASAFGQDLRAPQLQQWAQNDIEQLIALEGGGPTPPCYLRWRGRNAAELLQHQQAVASYEAALLACDATKCELSLPALPLCYWRLRRQCLKPCCCR